MNCRGLLGRRADAFVGLMACALATSAGCGSSCEDDGFGGANCDLSSIPQDPSSGAQTSTGDMPGTSSTNAAETSTGPEPSTSTGPDTETSTGPDFETSTGPGAETTTGPVTQTWCRDADQDGFGDPDDCRDIRVDDEPPDGVVLENTDCDDTSPETFPGAAPNDDVSACMADVDGDDYGDAAPANASVAAGTDCDDLESAVFNTCIECVPDATFCNDAGNSAQCNATGTWGVELEACGFGCDIEMGACWAALEVETNACVEVELGVDATLSAVASGGNGNYAYAWSPETTIVDPTAATTQASPAGPTTYTIEASDTAGNVAQDRVTVHRTDLVWDLQAPGCSSTVFAEILDEGAPPPGNSFFGGGTVRCNLETNSLPNAYVCPQVIDDARVVFNLEVVNVADNDAVGFVFGWQDASHFNLFSWKQTSEIAPWGLWERGVTIKRIEANDVSDITGEDLGASYDTAHGTILASPAEFHPMGWSNQVSYRLFVSVNGETTSITIVDQDALETVATGNVVDDVLGPGAIGSYDGSQRGACTGGWTSSCL